MEGRSAAALGAGFLFWLAVAYFLYQGERAGAALLALLACVAVAGYAVLRHLWRRRPRRQRPPRSDLPDFDFENVKPKDFE